MLHVLHVANKRKLWKKNDSEYIPQPALAPICQKIAKNSLVNTQTEKGDKQSSSNRWDEIAWKLCNKKYFMSYL